MISRKSFFRRIASAVVAIALAPEIAFGTRLEVAKPHDDLDLWELIDQVYKVARVRSESDDGQIHIYTDAAGVEACEGWLRQLQASQPA